MNISAEKTNTSKPPGRPRDEATRARIQEAAIKLLIEGGFLNLTCDAIARQAETSKATMYRWWPNKVQIVIEAFVNTLSPQLPIHKADTIEEFVTIHVKQFVKAMSGQAGKLLSAVIAAGQVAPELQAAITSYWIKPRREILRNALLEFQRKGDLSQNFDIELVLDAMYGPLHYILMVQRQRLTPSYAEKLAKILLCGLASK
jgi:AcrR family transcriptional regulator